MDLVATPAVEVGDKFPSGTRIANLAHQCTIQREYESYVAGLWPSSIPGGIGSGHVGEFVIIPVAVGGNIAICPGQQIA